MNAIDSVLMTRHHQYSHTDNNNISYDSHTGTISWLTFAVSSNNMAPKSLFEGIQGKEVTFKLRKMVGRSYEPSHRKESNSGLL